MELTKKSLLQHCREMNQYSTPELNDKLYLHQKGIAKIENLDEYVGVKVLWLQTNGIETIQNLNHMTELRHLYLNENMIKEINGENLSNLINLDTLNLENNYISKISDNDLSNLVKLSTLNLASNKLCNVQNLKGLLNCPSLSVLDLRNNNITVTDELIDEILSKLPTLRVLYLMSSNNQNRQNTISEQLNFYRKKLIGKCKNLTHLDDRPVFTDERRCCNAWLIGGIEAEREERQKISDEKKQKQERNHQAFLKLVEEAKNNGIDHVAPCDDIKSDCESESESD